MQLFCPQCRREGTVRFWLLALASWILHVLLFVVFPCLWQTSHRDVVSSLHSAKPWLASQHLRLLRRGAEALTDSISLLMSTEEGEPALAWSRLRGLMVS